jgi:Flp pilus assembly protein TadD
VHSLLLALCVLLVPLPAAAASVTDYLVAGTDHQYRGNLQAAEQAFRRAVQQEPDNAFALNQLGLVLAKQERFDEAAPLFRRVVQTDPDNVFGRLWSGVLLLRMGSVEEARALFREVLQLDSANANAYYFLGVIHFVEHNLTRAVQLFRKAQHADSGDPETHYRLARAFQGLDMVANAELEYRRTLELDPRHVRALDGLGWLLYNRGDTAEAVSTWQRSLELSGKGGEARHNLAKVYNETAYNAWTSGDAQRARLFWNKALDVDPGNKAAKYHLRKIR